MASSSTRVRGCEIGYEVSGAGHDLIWGHGLTQSRDLENRFALVDWNDVAARVLRYDARGHGLSESTPDLDSYTWEQLAHDQLALADHAGIDAYIAGGASMGCATALHAAVIAPERIDGLILVIPPTAWETRAAQAGVYEQGAKAVETYGVEAVIKASAMVPPPDPFVDDPDFASRRADGMRSWDPERLAHAMRGATGAQFPDREAVAAITCPTTVLAWTGDDGHPVGTAEELGRLIPHADVHLASTPEEIATWTAIVAHLVIEVAGAAADS